MNLFRLWANREALKKSQDGGAQLKILLVAPANASAFLGKTLFKAKYVNV